MTRDRVVAYALLAVASALIWACFAPGHMNIDSLAQIQEVDNWGFTNRHATMLLALWAPLYAIGVGPAFVLMAQVTVFALGGYLVLRVAFDRVPAAAIAAFVCFWPPVFGMLGSVGRDAWFAALMIASYGLLARAGQRDWPLRGRWLVLATVVIWLALASRQNAFPAMLPAAVLLVAMVLARPGAEEGRWAILRRRPRLAALGLGAGLTAAMLVTQLAGSIVVRADDVDPEQYLYIYDLAALSEREGENLFPPDVAAERGMGLIDSRFSVDTMVYLVYFYQPPFVPAPLASGPDSSLRDEWLDRMTGDPGEYLAARTELFGRQLALTRNARYVFIPDVIDNPYGYAVWLGGLNSAALDYLDAFTETEVEPANPFFALPNGGPLYTVWAYLLLAAAAAVVLLRRGAGLPQLSVGALALAALALQLGLFVMAMGTEYRFEFPAVAAAMLVAPVAIAELLRTRTRPRSPRETGARPGRS